MSKNKLVLATANPHKVQEIRQILSPVSELEIVSLRDFANAPELEESADSFEGNACMKARQCAQFTGLPSLADDSGLVIDALGGRPGIYSARYAPTAHERIERVLNEMQAISDEKRTARFIAVVALVRPDGAVLTREGRCEGRIARECRGQGGFGYDPIFFLPQYEQTMAELAEEEKNRISHRGRALQAIMPDLLSFIAANE